MMWRGRRRRNGPGQLEEKSLPAFFGLCRFRSASTLAHDRVITAPVKEFSDGTVERRLNQFVRDNNSFPLARLTISEERNYAISSIESPLVNNAGILFLNPVKHT